MSIKFVSMIFGNMANIRLAVMFLCLFRKINICLGADTISANESLSGGQTIESAGGVFVLGFFKPGKSPNYYVGMWYKQVTPKAVVWVANREKPVSDIVSSELKISGGNLVLFNEFKIPIWSTNSGFTSSPVVKAVLLDDGNFVLKLDGFNSSKPLWQSFDHPTDTWLAGSKLSFNKRTKTKSALVSWKNSEDPAPGLFSFELDPNDNSYVLLWNSSRRYWSTGSWKGHYFSLVPETRYPHLYHVDFVTNENESYVIYSFESSSITIARLMLDASGRIRCLYFQAAGWNVLRSFPIQQCQVYAVCGAYGICNENPTLFCNCLTGFEPKIQSDWALKDYSGGCIRKTNLQCASKSHANSTTDKFLKLQSMSLPANKEDVQVDGMVGCKSTCLNYCSCSAYAYDGNGCSIWKGDLLNMTQLQVGDANGGTIYLRISASEFPRPNKTKGKNIGVVIGSIVGLLVLVSLTIFLILRQRRKIAQRRKSLGDYLVVFGYRDLQNATKNFMEKLGGGGFGSVFKGVLPDSTIIAVKKLESISQGDKQFRAEVSTIGTIQHVNLVRLRGFCSQGTKKLLVYDFMSNGSLASHLFPRNMSNVLDWKTRYQIALGTARGLEYLHEKCRYCVIHCDIKPENILLDAQFCPKVADFGLAKLVGREFSRVLTTIRGTRGYLAPEWIAGVAITSKADVYSFGMMLFELVSGKRNSEQTKSNGKLKYFPSMATTVIVQGGDVLSLLDERLGGDANVDEVERVCKVACWCIQDDEAHRPSMGQVAQILDGIIEVNLPPVPRSLYFYDDDEDNVIFFAESSSSSSKSPCSDNNASIASSKAMNLENSLICSAS